MDEIIPSNNLLRDKNVNRQKMPEINNKKFMQNIKTRWKEEVETARKHSSRMSTVRLQPYMLHNEQVWTCLGIGALYRRRGTRAGALYGDLGWGPFTELVRAIHKGGDLGIGSCKVGIPYSLMDIMTDWLPETTENITFPKLCWWEVKIIWLFFIKYSILYNNFINVIYKPCLFQ